MLARKILRAKTFLTTAAITKKDQKTCTETKKLYKKLKTKLKAKRAAKNLYGKKKIIHKIKTKLKAERSWPLKECLYT